MKEILLGGILLYLANNLYSQVPDTLWTKTYGWNLDDRGYSIQQTLDGGYIVTGNIRWMVNESNVCLIKTDNNGDIVWMNVIGGSHWDGGNSVQQTNDGGYIVAGYTYSFGQGIPNNSNIYLIKTDENGDTIWTKVYGGVGNERSGSVQQTSDSGYIIVGETSSYGAGSYDFWLLKTDTDGDTVWTKTYGGSSGDCGHSGLETIDGGYLLVGHTCSYGAGDLDVWLVKTNMNGDTVWTKTYGGVSGDCCPSVQQTSDGGYVAAGFTASYGAGITDVYLIKTDANGDTLWTRTYGGTNWDDGFSVQQTSDGGYIIVGETESYGAGLEDVYLIKTDANGATMWTVTYGGTNYEQGRSVQQTSDNGYIIAGYTNSFGSGGYDIWLIKTKPDIGIKEKINKHVSGARIPSFVYGNILRMPGINKYIDVKIFDIVGREILSQEISPQDTYIKLNNLTSGVYFLSLKQENIKVSKFVLIK